jgi:hypothetical protein
MSEPRCGKTFGYQDIAPLHCSRRAGHTGACGWGKPSVAPPLTAGPVAPPPDLEESIARLREHVRRRSMSHTERFETTAERFYNETGLMAPGKSMPVEMWSDDYDARRNAAWVVFNKQVHDTFYADLERAIQALEAPRGAARPPHPGLSLSIQQDPLAISALLDDVKRQADAATTALFNVMRALQPVLGDDVWRVDRDGLPALITEKLSETVARPPASPPALEALLAKWRTKAAWLKGQESPDAVLAMGDHAAETTYTECADELAEAALAVPPEAPPR